MKKEQYYKSYKDKEPLANKWNYLVDRFYGRVPEDKLVERIQRCLRESYFGYMPDLCYGPDPDGDFDPQDQDENLPISPDNIHVFLRGMFEQGIGDFDNPNKYYDVECFKTDVIDFPWWIHFNTMAPEFLVDFNEALMLFCHDKYCLEQFGLAGQVIMFVDLSDWAGKEFIK